MILKNPFLYKDIENYVFCHAVSAIFPFISMPKRLSKESSSNTHLFAAPDVNNTNFEFNSEFVLFFDNEYSASKSIAIYLTCTTL